MQEYKIYKLIDPRDKSDRYVGITKNALIRLKLHIRDARQGSRINVALKVWLNELLDIGLTPELEILEIINTPYNTEALAREREQYWIQELASRGVPLLNVEGITRTYSKRGSTDHLLQLKGVKQYRLQARLSIAQLARLAQIDETTVRRAETGETIQETKAFAIAGALSQKLKQEITVDDLTL